MYACSESVPAALRGCGPHDDVLSSLTLFCQSLLSIHATYSRLLVTLIGYSATWKSLSHRLCWLWYVRTQLSACLFSVFCDSELTLCRPLLPYGYRYKASCNGPGYAIICNFWHPGTLTLSPERQSARISKITSVGLTRCDTGCFIAVLI